MYQNKRNRNRGEWVVGSREGAEERSGWKRESGHYEMDGIIIVYIASSLPNNYVKSSALCWLRRGHEQQDSNSVTVGQCPQSDMPDQEGSHNYPRCYSPCSKEPPVSFEARPHMQWSRIAPRKGVFSLSCQDHVQILIASTKNLAWKKQT